MALEQARVLRCDPRRRRETDPNARRALARAQERRLNQEGALRVCITGAARGIGKAIAERYRREGHEIVAPPRDEVELSDPKAVEGFARSAGPIDVLINNAGENRIKGFAEIEVEDVERILSVNVLAAYLLVRYIGVGMAERGWGRIVNLSSVYSLVSRPKRSMYSTTKSALNGLTRGAAVELGPGGVLVNAVCPGFVDTDMTRQNNSQAEIDALCAQVPLRRLASVDEIADLAHYLGSSRNTYITGQMIVIDGGFVVQ